MVGRCRRLGCVLAAGDSNWAINTAHMLEDFDVAWFEEPLKPDALDDFKALRERSPVPIATGECITRRQSFLPWFERRALDIVQPDVTKVGGISEQIQIARAANAFGIKYIGHGWNTAIGLAADLQLAAAVPTADLVEYIGGSPYVDDITEGGWTLDGDGMLAIPDGPGLGIMLKIAIALREDDPQLGRWCLPQHGALLLKVGVVSLSSGPGRLAAASDCTFRHRTNVEGPSIPHAQPLEHVLRAGAVGRAVSRECSLMLPFANCIRDNRLNILRGRRTKSPSPTWLALGSISTVPGWRSRMASGTLRFDVST